MDVRVIDVDTLRHSDIDHTEMELMNLFSSLGLEKQDLAVLRRQTRQRMDEAREILIFRDIVKRVTKNG